MRFVRAAGVLIVAVIALGCSAAAPPAASNIPQTPAATASAPPTAVATAPSPSPSPTAAVTPTPTLAPTPTPAPPATATPQPLPTPAPPSPSPVATPSPGSPGPAGSPSSEPIDISAYLTVRLSVVNLAEVPVDVVVSLVDTSTGDVTQLITLVLEPLDFESQKVPPNVFDVVFTVRGSATALASCRMQVENDDSLDFAALDDAVAVSKRGYVPADRSELFVATSTLCMAGG